MLFHVSYSFFWCTWLILLVVICFVSKIKPCMCNFCTVICRKIIAFIITVMYLVPRYTNNVLILFTTHCRLHRIFSRFWHTRWEDSMWYSIILFVNLSYAVLMWRMKPLVVMFQCPSLHLVHVETIGDDWSRGVAARRNTAKVSLERYRQVCSIPLVDTINRMLDHCLFGIVIMHLSSKLSSCILTGIQGCFWYFPSTCWYLWAGKYWWSLLGCYSKGSRIVSNSLV
jgi:hypothetical protein